ncbi:hypothetical protein CYMTET_25704, partial [Cymbomonas tetramitiformis]
MEAGMKLECARLQQHYNMLGNRTLMYFSQLTKGRTKGKIYFEQVILGGGGHGLSLANSWCTGRGTGMFPGLSVSDDAMFRGARMTSSYWWLFRHVVLWNKRINPSEVPTKHQIVVTEKKGATGGRTERGQRRIENIDAVVGYLTEKFPEANVMKMNFHYLPFEQQLE